MWRRAAAASITRASTRQPNRRHRDKAARPTSAPALETMPTGPPVRYSRDLKRPTSGSQKAEIPRGYRGFRS